MSQRNAGNGGQSGQPTKVKDEMPVLVPKKMIDKIDGRIRKAMGEVGDLAGMELTDRQIASARKGWIVKALETRLTEAAA